jgi:hypothetical protein
MRQVERHVLDESMVIDLWSFEYLAPIETLKLQSSLSD